jgi:hypothetical protein
MGAFLNVITVQQAKTTAENTGQSLHEDMVGGEGFEPPKASAN